MHIFSIIQFSFIIILRNMLFEDKVFKYLKILLPVPFIAFYLYEYVFVSIPNLALIGVTSMFILLFKFLTNKDLMKITIEVFIIMILLIVFDAVCLSMCWIFLNDIGQNNNDVKLILILSTVVYIILAFIIYKLKQKGKLGFIEKLKPNKIIISTLISGMVIFLMAKTINDKAIIDDKVLVELILYTAILAILIINIANNMRVEIEEKNRLKLENNFKPLLDEYIQRLRESEHEYKNNLNAIYSMINLCDEKYVKQEVQNYIVNLKHSDTLNNLLYVDNLILRSVLYSKLAVAEEEGIRLKYSIKSNLNNCKLDDMELVIVLSNLLNNAIEATVGVENSFIEVDINESYNNEKVTYYIKVANNVSILEEINLAKIMDKGISTKGKNRGYGLYNVKKLIKKANGNILIDLQKDILNIEIIL